MMIDKIGGVNPLNNIQNTKRTNEASTVASTSDSIELSAEAKEASQAYFMNQLAEETPDVRSDLVASIKEKIKDPNYLNPAVISATAEKIMTAYGL